MKRAALLFACLFLVAQLPSCAMENNDKLPPWADKNEKKEKKGALDWLKKKLLGSKKEASSSRTPLMRSTSANGSAALMPDFFRAIEKNDIDMVKRLVVFAIDINHQEKGSKDTPLLAALKNLHLYKKVPAEEQKARAIIGLILSKQFIDELDLEKTNSKGFDAKLLAKKYELENALLAIQRVESLQEMNRQANTFFSSKENSLTGYAEWQKEIDAEKQKILKKQEQEKKEQQDREKLLAEVKMALGLEGSLPSSPAVKRSILTPQNSLYPIKVLKSSGHSTSSSVFFAPLPPIPGKKEAETTNNNNAVSRNRSATMGSGLSPYSMIPQIERMPLKKKESQEKPLLQARRPSGGSSSDDELLRSSKSKKKDFWPAVFEEERKKSTGSSSNSEHSEEKKVLLEKKVDENKNN